MSYIKSLRFKLMLLCVIPLFTVAFAFIAHSVIIAHQVKDNAATAYTDTLISVGAEAQIVQAVKDTTLEMGWIAKQWVTFFLIAFVICYIPITINIKKFITPIRQAAKYSDSLARGDIQIEVVKNRTDEIGVLQESFQNLVRVSRKQAELIKLIADGDLTENYTPLSDADKVGYSLVQMMERNNAAMLQIAMSTNQLLTATSQIADSSQSLASGATEQAAAVEELSASVSEVLQTSHQNAEMANKAAALGVEIMRNAENGTRQMEKMIAAVKGISDASSDINKVIKVIEDIAFQTNILALNASVEAARAGQYGKGFAVVAEEVRNLANRSAEAAKDSGRLITNSIEKAELGTKIANETAAGLAEIAAGVGESGKIIQEIAQSNGTLDTALEQITRGVDQVSQVVQQNSAAAEETAAATVEMNSQSEILHNMVAQFKLKDKSIESMRNPTLPSRRQSSSNENANPPVRTDRAYGKY